jgi:hypothetical protein
MHLLLLVSVIGLTVAAGAQTKTPDPNWDGLQALVGDWAGEGGGGPGQGGGGFSFQPDLKSAVYVRRNRADYPAQQGRPAYSHEDLMVVYRDGGRVRAFYYDNEMHLIHYTVQVAGEQIVFLGDIEASAPRFRFTYSKASAAQLKIKFEIAPPGKPDQFATYIEATAKRK